MIAPLEELLAALTRLPAIGRRSAERIAFYLLAKPDHAARLAEVIGALHERIHTCDRCGNFAERDLCPICADPQREASALCVVARPWEIGHIERTGEYRGLYHVLGGLVSPSSGVEAEDLSVDPLLARVANEGVQEIILALEPRLEGELTAMHLLRKLKPLGVRVTQIAQGVPAGRDLESADEITLGRAFRGRVPL